MAHSFEALDIDKDSVICSDGFRSYGVLAKKLHMGHKAVNLAKGIRVTEGVFHIQNVNSLLLSQTQLIGT